MTSLSTTSESWEEKAQRKRESILAGIPKEWQLSTGDLERAQGQRDLTGPFINSFLTPETVAIISRDPCEIVALLQERNLSALQVATAFCQTAAIAHQIVSQTTFEI